jgi:ElaB/YqjD/DUF883 family membrane-anchored ribosome-binding protein
MEKANDKYEQLKNDTQQLLTNMKEAGRENLQEIKSELDSKLNTAQQKFSELKEAGKENLQGTKDAFDTAIDELKDAYQKAKAKYQKSDEQK